MLAGIETENAMYYRRQRYGSSLSPWNNDEKD